MSAKIVKNSSNKGAIAEFITAARAQSVVIFAMYIKEIKARFGQYNLGFLWALLEPIAHVTVFSLLFYFKSHNSEGIEYPIFVMLGILPWLLFKNIIRRSMTAISANRGIFVYPGVRPIDAILGRVFLEVNIFIFVSITLTFIFYLLGFDVFYQNFLMFIYSAFLIIVMATGLGILFAVLDSYNNATQKFVGMSFRFLYFLSGIFYPVTIIPEPYLSYFLYNPVLQGIMMMRNSFNPEYDATFINPNYLAFVAFTCFAVGIFYYSLHWKNVVEKIK
jgi:capsular polysaccharide transport system permease protein